MIMISQQEPSLKTLYFVTFLDPVSHSQLNNEKRVFYQFSWEVTEKGKQKGAVLR